MSFATTAAARATVLIRWVALCILICSLALPAQEVSVPLRVQYPILLKALTFDRALKTRCGGDIVLGILYQGAFRKSLNVKDELLDAIRELSPQSVEGLPLHVVPIEYGPGADLDEELSRNGVNTLYVAPLRAVDIGDVAAATRRKGVLSLTGVPEYVEDGLSIGVWIRGDRPALIINVPASRAEGAQLDSRLLDLARTIR
jgi:hypothetical protein